MSEPIRPRATHHENDRLKAATKWFLTCVSDKQMVVFAWSFTIRSRIWSNGVQPGAGVEAPLHRPTGGSNDHKGYCWPWCYPPCQPFPIVVGCQNKIPLEKSSQCSWHKKCGFKFSVDLEPPVDGVSRWVRPCSPWARPPPDPEGMPPPASGWVFPGSTTPQSRCSQRRDSSQ